VLDSESRLRDACLQRGEVKHAIYFTALVSGVPLVMKQDEAFYPVQVELFGRDAAVSYPERIAHLIPQIGLYHGRLSAPLAFLFRLRFLSLYRCFSDDSHFYSPEKPIRQGTFRVSTSC